MENLLLIDGNTLSIQDVYDVAWMRKTVGMTKEAGRTVERSHERLLEIIRQNKPVYGINTGFGIFANRTISLEDSKQLNRNLIVSHAVGTGQPLEKEIIRAAMLIRVNALAKGYSGVDVKIIQSLIEMINLDVIPVILDKGSLGSSGDLCMLAQVAMVLSADESNPAKETGQAYYQGEILPGHIAMEKAGIERHILAHKDGLALINGATFSAAILALCAYETGFLCELADMTASLSLEALLGRTDAFHSEIHKARGLEGQIKSASRIQGFLEGSSWANSHSRVQDAYSLRCAPQVHGAVRDTLKNVESILEKEINAATDNPLMVGDDRVISGGNFHGEPVGMYADFLSIALSELAAISERRIFRLLDSNLNYGLPQMLVDESSKEGVNSGIMMLQYTAAALVLENQVLATPDSIRSLPTSANQEDHNANAYLAAYHTWQVMCNVYKVLTIEMFSACRALEQRISKDKKKNLGRRTSKVFELVRSVSPYHAEDKAWGAEIEELNRIIMLDWEFKQEFLDCIN